MYMKKLGLKYVTIICMLFCFAINGYCKKEQKGIYTAYLYKGYWSEWKETDYDYIGFAVKRSQIRIAGNNGSFCLYRYGNHPSDFFFNFTITGYTPPSKKEIKEHYKRKQEWVYSGYVEYYICDVYPTIENCFVELGRLLYPSDLQAYNYDSKLALVKAKQIKDHGHFTPIGLKRIRKSATIKIMPYKNVPEFYNFFFDNVGYAVELGVFSTRFNSK